MIGSQDADGRGAGVSRYVDALAEALLADSAHQYVLYFHDRFGGLARGGGRAEVRLLTGAGPLAMVAQHLVERNPDDLDAYLVTAPFSTAAGYLPPVRPTCRPALLALVCDLGGGPMGLPGYRERVERLRQYDRLLTTSEIARRDVLAALGVPPGRVANIGLAVGPQPGAAAESLDCLEALGIRGPFVLTAAGANPSRDCEVLCRAFARLAEPVRTTHQLVVVCDTCRGDLHNLRELADRHGLADRLVVVNAATESQRRAAYRRCAAFACVPPGAAFGLPVLEALQHGAPVLAASATAPAEAAADAILPCQAGDDAHTAAQLGRLLTDPALAADLRRRGPERARDCDWPEPVRRMHKALRSLPRPPAPRPLLAMFAPLPPRHMATADHTLALLANLRRRYTIHLYHERGPIPQAALTDSGLAAFDHRLFERQHRAWNYHAILYQLGDSDAFAFVYETLIRHPGIVTLHEPGLAAFQTAYGRWQGDALAHLLRELAYCRPDLSERQRRRRAGQLLRGDPAAVAGLDLNRRVFTHAHAVVVPDAAVAGRLRVALPAHRDRIHAIPPGSDYVELIEQVAASCKPSLRASA